MTPFEVQNPRPSPLLQSPNRQVGDSSVQPQRREFACSVAHTPLSVYLLAVHLEPFTELRWAYQLHYYICFRTRWRRAQFGENDKRDLVARFVAEVCGNHDYHLLQQKVYPDHLRCLVSLKPDHAISRVVNKLKSNVSRQFCAEIGLEPPLWATGYLARSVGRVRIQAVKQYLAHQAEHHGYGMRLNPPVFRYRAKEPVVLRAEHAVFDLSHHLVLATRYRRSIFQSDLGNELINYWVRVALRHGFAIDEATVLPDHVHMLVRLPTKLSIEECAMALMNNSQHWMGKQHAHALVREGVDRVWEPSAYAGTCGIVTTAQVKAFLGREQ